MINLINLTPHELSIIDYEGNPITLKSHVLDFPETYKAARIAEEFETEENLEYGMFEIPVQSKQFLGVIDLPVPRKNTVYVVSSMVFAQVPHRNDVVAPGPLIRNEQGHPVGCRGLTAHPGGVYVPQ